MRVLGKNIIGVEIIFILKRFISMFFYTDNKLLKIKMSLKGLRDGILNKMGKSVTP